MAIIFSLEAWGHAMALRGCDTLRSGASEDSRELRVVSEGRQKSKWDGPALLWAIGSSRRKQRLRGQDETRLRGPDQLQSRSVAVQISRRAAVANSVGWDGGWWHDAGELVPEALDRGTAETLGGLLARAILGFNLFPRHQQYHWVETAVAVSEHYLQIVSALTDQDENSLWPRRSRMAGHWQVLKSLLSAAGAGLATAGALGGRDGASCYRKAPGRLETIANSPSATAETG